MTTGEPLDPWGMVAVHQVYRREFRLLGRLVAAVPENDTDRAPCWVEKAGVADRDEIAETAAVPAVARTAAGRRLTGGAA